MTEQADYDTATLPAAFAVADPLFAAGRRYAVMLLTLTYAASYVDRQILAILLPSIKRDFQLDDTMLGLLTGPAFGLFYATLGIPVAMWADRANRRNLIAAAVTVFSVMTALCGLAANFWQLALARIGVGVGEAGTSPPTHSMIADMFPSRGGRTQALTIFGLGANIGTLIGFLLGGFISQLYNWHVAFMVVGVPGLLIALLVRLTLRNPARGGADGLAERAEPAPGLGKVIAFLWTQRSYRHNVVGQTLAAFGMYTNLAWEPSFFSRSFGMSPAEVGTTLALMMGFIGGAGAFLTGSISDRLGRRDMRWNMWVLVIMMSTAFIFWVVLFLSTTKLAALLILGVAVLSLTASIGPSVTMTQATSPVRMRSTASAIYLLIINIFAGAFGPQLVGFLSDLYRPAFGNESLRYALLTVSVSWLWGAFHFWRASRTLREDVERARLISVAAG